MKNFCEDLFFYFCEDPFFFGEHLRFVSWVLGLGLEHSCPWPRECLSSERLSLALASDFFCVLGLGLEPCVLDSTSDCYIAVSLLYLSNQKKTTAKFAVQVCGSKNSFAVAKVQKITANLRICGCGPPIAILWNLRLQQSCKRAAEL